MNLTYQLAMKRHCALQSTRRLNERDQPSEMVRARIPAEFLLEMTRPRASVVQRNLSKCCMEIILAKLSLMMYHYHTSHLSPLTCMFLSSLLNFRRALRMFSVIWMKLAALFPNPYMVHAHSWRALVVAYFPPSLTGVLSGNALPREQARDDDDDHDMNIVDHAQPRPAPRSQGSRSHTGAGSAGSGSGSGSTSFPQHKRVVPPVPAFSSALDSLALKNKSASAAASSQTLAHSAARSHSNSTETEEVIHLGMKGPGQESGRSGSGSAHSQHGLIRDHAFDARDYREKVEHAPQKNSDGKLCFGCGSNTHLLKACPVAVANAGKRSFSRLFFPPSSYLLALPLRALCGFVFSEAVPVRLRDSKKYTHYSIEVFSSSFVVEI
jgi:hypothetical protein